MSRDYGELEREFIEGLADDTGRDLAGWLSLIDSHKFDHRNDMIDWLRQQGLTFAKASRLERIHHNGGKPLYGERPNIRVPVEAATTLAPPAKPEPPPSAPPIAKPVPTPARPIAAASGGDLNIFLAKAKGYRPLAELLLRIIREAVPGTALHIRETHVDLAAPSIYGALAVTAKDVRLALDLGDHPFQEHLKRLRLAGTAASLTHTIVLDDARRIDTELRALIAKAASRANS